MTETLLLEDLNNPVNGNAFSMRIQASASYGTFLQLPAKPLMAALAYDAFFEHRHRKPGQLIRSTSPIYIDPNLRADNAFTPDFFSEKEVEYAETGSEEGYRIGDETVYAHSVDVAQTGTSQNGPISFINGKHRTRLFYAFGMKDIPLIELNDPNDLVSRVDKINSRIEASKTLFNPLDVMRNFSALPVSSFAEMKENLYMFKKILSAKNPEDIFLNENDFRNPRVGPEYL